MSILHSESFLVGESGTVYHCHTLNYDCGLLSLFLWYITLPNSYSKMEIRLEHFTRLPKAGEQVKGSKHRVACNEIIFHMRSSFSLQFCFLSSSWFASDWQKLPFLYTQESLQVCVDSKFQTREDFIVDTRNAAKWTWPSFQRKHNLTVFQ